jgi:tetratricopeptide (TPR) repeat protein
MGLGKQVRITRPPEKFRKYLDKKAQVISLVPIAQHPLQYKVKVDDKILTLPIDALEPCKIDRDEGGEGLTRYLTVNDLMYCPDHEMEVCGSCSEDHRYTNFMKEYTEDDCLVGVESWLEGMQWIGAPPRRAPVMRGKKKEAPGNPAVFQPVISEHLVMIEDEFNPLKLPIWPEGKSMETALRNITAFSSDVVPEAFKLPVRRLRETIVVLGRNFDSFLAKKDPNEPMARCFLQDSAQTQALSIDLLLPVRQMEVNGIVFPIFAVRWLNAKATDGFEQLQMIMATMERNTKMSNIRVETDEIDLMAAFFEENTRHLAKKFVRSNGKKHMSVSLITPISDDMQTAHHTAILYCGQCGTSGCDLMQCTLCRKTSYCSRVCQKKNWPHHKKTCSGRTTKAASSAGRAKMPTASGQDYPHELFSKALRKYAHPAAIADLDALKRGGKSWERFLEAFGTNCRDFLPSMSQQEVLQGVEKTYRNVSSACPLRKALIATCGQQVPQLLTDYVYDSLLSQIRTFGRPLESKTEILRAHEMRLNHDMARQRQRQNDMHIFRHTSSSVRKDVSLHQPSTDWSSLTQIFVRDLKLYDSHQSMYIEGKLLIDPFTPMVGTTTILEDSNGDVILIALYNFLPEGLYGPESVPVASAKIPKGATVRIAEPLMKVFRDGSRGLRIDNPNEISVISSGKANKGSEKQLLLEAKNAGNQLVRAHKYLSASETYIGGLRSAEVIPTILSNRSQAYAMIGDWERSFADAAASLTIRPGNKKTWSRYETAREKLLEDADHFDSISLISTLLPNLMYKAAAQAADTDTNGKDLMQLKNDGNAAFQQRKYAEAAKLYTAALETYGETERALLSNWALCCLSSQAHLDVVAAAAASLRIRPEAKAVIRLATAIFLLGEAETCNKIIAQTDIISDEMAYDIANDARSSMPLLKRIDKHFTIQELGSPKYVPRWIGNIETFDAGSKGRGVRATHDLKEGEIVLLEHPLASASRDSAKKAKESLFTIDKMRTEDASQTFLCQAILLRSQREAVLSRVVDCLFDGTNARPLTALDNLIPSLNSSPPLLPTHYEYCPGEAKVEFNSDRIGAIVSTNSHGSGSNVELKKGSFSALYPATSMFNHSPTPNCDLDASGAGNYAKVIVKNDVKVGEELFICYHQDENVVCRNWLS